MKKMKLLSMILAFALLVTAITGCGTSKGGADKTTVADTTTAVAATNVAPIEEVKPKLTFLASYAKYDPNQDIIANELEKLTGYQVEYFMLPAERAEEKLNLDMSSGVEYDIMFLLNGLYRNMLAKDIIISLDELVDKFGPNIKAANSQQTWDNVRVKGKIYGIPATTAGVIGQSIGIRQDILDELNLKVPTTIEEFYTVAKTIKEKKNIIPLTANKPFVDIIASGFGLSVAWKEVNGSAVHRLKQQGMKEYVEFMKKLYAEGLIDSEMPVNKYENINEKFTSGKAAMLTWGWGDAPSVKPALAKTLPEAKMSLVHPLKGSNGQQEISTDKGVNKMAMIHKSSKNAEHAIKFINAMVDQDNFKYLALGKEGEHYKVENDKFIPLLPKFNDERNNATWFLAGIIEDKWPSYWSARVSKNVDMFETFSEMSMDNATIGKKDLLGYVPGLEKWSKYSQALNKMESDTLIKIIAGGESMDTFQTLLETWDKEGGAEATQEANDWLKNKVK